MICGVHGSPGNIVTEPTWSNRKPVGAALACAGGCFICAQPAIPARAAAAMNNANEKFLIPKNPDDFSILVHLRFELQRISQCHSERKRRISDQFRTRT